MGLPNVTARIMRLACAVVLLLPSAALAEEKPDCAFICGVAAKAEPTFTVENLASRHRLVTSEGSTTRVSRERVFESVLAVDFETRWPRLGFTAEAITAPFSGDHSAEFEFETNFYWLTEAMSRGWLSSHFDVVDQLSPGERPAVNDSYTHKLDFELDTASHVFRWLPDGRWLRGVELETSLDYLATGIPKRGDVFADGSRYLDDASHWSLSIVLVLPVVRF